MTLVVGVGASAGGLDALERLIAQINPSTPACYIIAQHLSPDHRSLMAEILGRRTTIEVREVTHGQPLEPHTILLVPAHKNVVLEDNLLQLRERSGPGALNLPIDVLFESVARCVGANCVGVILSGTGSDGRLGIEAIKREGGYVVVQTPSSARFDGMPLAALSTQKVDAVLPPEEIAQHIEQHFADVLRIASGAASGAEDPRPTVDRILAVLKSRGANDFSEYKQATVVRRIERRQAALGLATLEEYLGRVEVDNKEVELLAHDLLISVTRFFRDPGAWQALSVEALPALVRRCAGGSMRVWVPGCATGQEAYSMVIALLEEMERIGVTTDLKVFATDLDREALRVAAQGVYSAEQLADVRPEQVARYFERRGDEVSVGSEVRRRVVFAEHNLTRDPPFTRLDAISCRNVLIYLGIGLQRQVLSNFTFGLRPGGTLLLGPAESLGDVAEHYRVVNGHWRLYERLPSTISRPRPWSILPNRARPSEGEKVVRERELMIEAAFQMLTKQVAPTSALVDDRFELLHVFGNGEGLLSMPLGGATLQLPSLVPESHRAPLIVALRRAKELRAEVRFVLGDTTPPSSVRIMPLPSARSDRCYFVVVFENGIPSTGVITETAPAHQLEALESELALVRASLQTSIEELETANEELQATNEELLASNEELQSTNEELQSVNEELGTVNSEHQAKIAELTELNDDLHHLFQSTTVGTLFLDDKLLVRRFSPLVTQVFPLLTRDTDRPIQDIATRIVGDFFVADCKRVLENGEPVEREVHTVDGGSFMMRLAPYILARRISGVVANFVDTTPLKTALVSAHRLQRIVDSLPVSVVAVDATGHITLVNDAWVRFGEENGLKNAQWIGQSYLDASSDAPEVVDGIKGVLSGKSVVFIHEYPCHSPTVERWFGMKVAPCEGEPGAVITHLEIRRRARPEHAL